MSKITPLTSAKIADIKSNYPPLTEEEFRYSKVSKGISKAESKGGNMLLVPLIKTGGKYFLLSPLSHKCYIKHRIPEIPNQAPTIEQWFQELRVFPNELDLPNIPRLRTKATIAANPKPEFFKNANDNFASSLNARHRKEKGWFVYYYYVEPESNRILHLDEPEARQLYCKKFEQSIMFERSPARPVFEELWRTCMTRSRNIPIVLKSRGIQNSLDAPSSVANKYHDYRHCFSATYCLTEMLLKFPNLDKCIWNVEVAPKEQPPYIGIPRPKPTLVYDNPHRDKVYECDRKKRTPPRSRQEARAAKNGDVYADDDDTFNIADYLDADELPQTPQQIASQQNVPQAPTANADVNPIANDIPVNPDVNDPLAD